MIKPPTRALAVLSLVTVGAQALSNLWKRYMSTPTPFPTTGSLGQQIAKAEAPVFVSPVDAFLTQAEASGSEAELAAAAVKLLAAESTAAIPGLVALKTITAHWLHGRIDGWLARNGLAPSAPAS